MPTLLTKSQENTLAAQKLVTKQMYTASVHCAYYGCFQHIKQILHNKLNFDYAKQDNANGKDSHLAILDEIVNKAPTPQQAKDIRNIFQWLKSERKRADYSIDIFKDTVSLDVISKSITLHFKLKEIWKI